MIPNSHTERKPELSEADKERIEEQAEVNYPFPRQYDDDRYDGFIAGAEWGILHARKERRPPRLDESMAFGNPQRMANDIARLRALNGELVRALELIKVMALLKPSDERSQDIWEKAHTALSAPKEQQK